MYIYTIKKMNYNALLIKNTTLPINIINSITGFLHNEKEQYDKVIYSLNKKFINEIINKKSYNLNEVETFDKTFLFYWHITLLRASNRFITNQYAFYPTYYDMNNTQILRDLCFFNGINVKKSYSKKKMVSLLLTF